VAGGYTLYIKEGKPVYEYNYVGQTHTKIASSKPLSPGASTIRVEFKYDGSGRGKGGEITLFINDEKVGEGRIDKTELAGFGTENFDIGMDNGSPVSEDYEPAFAYTGIIKKVEINIKPSALSTSDQQRVHGAERAAALAIE
jgi:arylsulfatase